MFVFPVNFKLIMERFPMTTNLTNRGVAPGKKAFKKIYVAVLMFFVGRALAAASKVDSGMKKELAELPDQFSFKLQVLPAGPSLTVGKNEQSRFKHYVRSIPEDKIDVRIMIKHLDAAFLLFTFQESTARSFASDRMIVKGDLTQAISVVRCLNIVEVYLLPKFIARLAVKRYPDWPFFRKVWRRSLIYTRTVLGV